MPRHPGTHRTGLFPSLALLLLGTPAAVVDFGLNGTGWDVVVIIIAVVAPSMTVATLALVPFAWNASPAPSYAVAIIQLASILLALPAFAVAVVDGLPPAAIMATIGVLLNLLAAYLVSAAPVVPVDPTAPLFDGQLPAASGSDGDDGRQVNIGPQPRRPHQCRTPGTPFSGQRPRPEY